MFDFFNHKNVIPAKCLTHLLNGNKKIFSTFYNKHHNKIDNYIYNQLQTINTCFRTCNNKPMEIIMQEHCEVLLMLTAQRVVHIIEVT